LFAILLFVFNTEKKLPNIFLALFLLAVGVDALDTLLYWSPSIKVQYLPNEVNIFFYIKFGIYLAPQMLYFYVKSTIFSDYKFNWKEAIHLIPLGLFPLYLLILFSSFNPHELQASIMDYAILFNNPVYQIHLWARNLLYVGYCLMAYHLLDGYQARLKENFSNIERIDFTWLKILVGGFLGIWMWVFSGYLLNLAHISFGLADKMGIIGNFFSFIFVNTMVFYSLANSGIVRSLPRESLTPPTESKEPEVLDQTAVEKINQAMQEKKLFLDPELTIEQLAEVTGIPTRKISNTINRHFNQNFFDYINFYRVEQAKAILTQLGKEAPMLEVMADAGFNSKSTFYRAFKKHLAMTPTEYCDYIQTNAKDTD
jgi:AraC-like DNA-binding protein